MTLGDDTRDTAMKGPSDSVHPAGIPAVLGRGAIDAAQCEQLTRQLKMTPQALAVQLLPLASGYAVTPISGFRVGAVAVASTGPGGYALYFGANMEFKGLSLQQTIHAEVAAVVHAWHRGAGPVTALAVSHPPCGYCRQFLNEWVDATDLEVIVAPENSRTQHRTTLGRLLPDAFGPADLSIQDRLPGTPLTGQDLHLSAAALDDPVVRTAHTAAVSSYAPYSGNRAGCAVKTATGDIFTGRYLETAAYTPCLSPLQSALICFNLAGTAPGPPDSASIRRVVLVEAPTGIRQKGTVALLLASWAPRIRLEYHELRQQ